MKKIVMVLVSVVMITAVEAKGKETKGTKDPVIMTVAGKDIPISEFLYIAKKDDSVDLRDKKSLENFVELFKNYKLKVADAESVNFHTHPKFEQELENYKRQLQESYLSDKTGEDSALRLIYDRTLNIPGFKQILFRLPGGIEIFPKDTVETYKNAIEAYNRIMNGESFESVGESLTKDREDEGVIYVNVEHASPLEMTDRKSVV